MIFRHFLLDMNESNAFILGDEKTLEAILIDAGCWDPAIEEFVAEHRLNVTTIFITHDHYDHTSGLEEYMKQFNADLVSWRGRAARISGRKVAHGDEIQIGELTGKVIGLSGHTADSAGLVFPGLVFSGDALFAGSIGGTGSERAHAREVENIRQHIFSLPGNYEVHTGHGPSSTVAIERDHNPFFHQLA